MRSEISHPEEKQTSKEYIKQVYNKAMVEVLKMDEEDVEHD